MDDGIWGWDGRWGTGGVRSDGQSVSLWFVDSAVLLKLTSFLGPSLNPCGIFLPKVWFLASHILHNLKKLAF